ncbi:hypothetical protein BV22DRAFT_1056084 [Leucogyrophana mollusca]|uniref:Uncharacterized protein n=1 Tax=Leucogyrophana mollusca TaxID=85980 RepID=A0ACB8BWE6_9AGAM|nr:hypothetical protein BV22DRAFT_1056084 [Leucogyrophana mollusca]
MTRAHESHFGPPSEPINIAKFLQDAATVELEPDVASNPHWQELSQEQRDAVEAECTESISELKTAIESTWDNPTLCAQILRSHDTAVASLHGQTDTPVIRGKKRKRPNGEGGSRNQEVTAMQEKLDAINLKCWGLNPDSAPFMRAPKNSDCNTLSSVKAMGNGVALFSTSEARPTALITLTVHNRLPWGYSFLSRSSQHAVLSSQTLAEFISVIPCVSSEMPVEMVDESGTVIDYDLQNVTAAGSDEGCLLCIEGLVYGDDCSDLDYAGKLLSHLQKIPAGKRPQLSRGSTSLSGTTFESLTLRVNQPYWLLHQGNCEHFIVVDQIRLPHPSDPLSGYPLTLHITPPLLDLCRACTKVPAVYSIVGDIRLGESPCLMCAPCWRVMGPPKEEEVMVVPLVKYEKGWGEAESS